MSDHTTPKYPSAQEAKFMYRAIAELSELLEYRSEAVDFCVLRANQDRDPAAAYLERQERERQSHEREVVPDRLADQRAARAKLYARARAQGVL